MHSSITCCPTVKTGKICIWQKNYEICIRQKLQTSSIMCWWIFTSVFVVIKPGPRKIWTGFAHVKLFKIVNWDFINLELKWNIPRTFTHFNYFSILCSKAMPGAIHAGVGMCIITIGKYKFTFTIVPYLLSIWYRWS